MRLTYSADANSLVTMAPTADGWCFSVYFNWRFSLQQPFVYVEGIASAAAHFTNTDVRRALALTFVNYFRSSFS